MQQSKSPTFLFVQRLYAYLLILRYLELLSKQSPSGNKTSQTDANGNSIHTYTYDPIYELLSADHPNITDENYTYDPVGNRLTTTVDNANRLIEDQNHTYQYDNNGNLIRKTHKITGIITQYTYDYENRLIKINLPAGITAEYKYDPFGRRIEKNISGQITVQYLYDNEDIIMEYAAIIPTNTNITTKYIHGPGIDEPLAMLRNNKTYYYHADVLGSITRMTDQNGNIAQTIRYDSFGNIKSISNPLLIQPYAWTGREYDVESGFYYLRNRYYDPKTGRFISKDPIGFNGGDVNLFRYVGNNAVNWVDPWGLEWIYSQSSGQLNHYVVGGNNTYIGTGYSGQGEGLNNPIMQGVPNVGPIPQGTYNISPAYNHENLGPATMNLGPRRGTNTFGRNAFRIHGDNPCGCQSASQGCIILPRNIRDQIAGSGDNELRVVP